LGDDAFDVVAELDHDARRVDVADEPAVSLCLVYLIDIEEHVFCDDDFRVVADFHDLVPDVDADNSESAFSCSIDFEIGEGDRLGHCSHFQAYLFAAHDLIAFEVVVFFCPEFINVADFTVEVDGVCEELFLDV
jgi:hypothetical protein